MKPKPMNFGRWLGIFMLTWAALHAIIVGLLGLAFNIPLQKLFLPYVLFLTCGLLASSLVYWAHEAYDRPRAGALRLAFAVFSTMMAFLWALELSEVWVGLISKAAAIHDDAPYILPSSLIVALIVYFMVRKRLEAARDRRTS